MIRDAILNLINEKKNDLKHYRIKSLYLFGSVARDEENKDSDIDILVSFDGVATFDRYMDLKFYLEDLLQRKVDLITEAGIRPELRKYVEEDLIRVSVISNFKKLNAKKSQKMQRCKEENHNLCVFASCASLR